MKRRSSGVSRPLKRIKAGLFPHHEGAQYPADYRQEDQDERDYSYRSGDRPIEEYQWITGGQQQ